MGRKTCPHCGDLVSARARACGCGYEFTGSEPRGASVARTISARMLEAEPRQKPARPAAKKTRREKASRRKRPTRAAAALGGTSVPGPEGWDPPPGAPRPQIGLSDSSKLLPCPSCPALISRRAQNCPKCGQPTLLACEICTNEIPWDSQSCPECGDPDPFSG